MSLAATVSKVVITLRVMPATNRPRTSMVAITRSVMTTMFTRSATAAGAS